MFAELWDWSCFLDLPQQTCSIGLVDGKTSLSNTLDIIWCGVQILSVVLRISDRATENFGLAPEEAFMCLLRLVLLHCFRIFSMHLCKIVLCSNNL